MTAKHAQTSTPILDTLTERWSPRAYDADHALTEGELRGVFEAARWSPSGGNTQPWRFIIARRGSESFNKVEASLMPGNAAWASTASAFIVSLAVTENDEGKVMRWAEYDLGQAVAHLSVQAHSEGLYVHQMGGFDPLAIIDAFSLDARFRPVTIATIGKIGEPEQLSESLLERELAPRTRLPLNEIIVVND
ncbi:MAG: nitroreductase family protein [Leucobacter sp.]